MVEKMGAFFPEGEGGVKRSKENAMAEGGLSKQ